MFRKLLSPILFTCILSYTCLAAASGTWTGPTTGGAWNVDANWTGASFPNGAADVATINTAHTTINLPVNINLAQLNLSTSINPDINGTGQITLTGNNIGITASNPILFSNPRIDNPIAFSAGTTNQIDLNEKTVLSITGNLTGAPTNFQVTGSGILLLAGDNTYSGDTLITGQILLAGTSINSNFIISNGGTLATLGTGGSIGGTVTNSSTPGFGIGVDLENNLTVSGYTQTSTGSMGTLLSPTSTSTLIVTNAAAIDGAILIGYQPGIYKTTQTFTLLTAGTGVTGTFPTVFSNKANVDFSLIYQANAVLLRHNSHHVVTPTELLNLQGNDKNIGTYMFGDTSIILSSQDMENVANNLLSLSPSEFDRALITLSPLATTAVPFASFQNNLQMAVILDKQYKDQLTLGQHRLNSHGDDDLTAPCFAIPRTGLFFEPIGIYYNQRNTGGNITDVGQVPFESFTYGAGTGWEQVIADKFVVEAGVGYTHSNLHWEENFGNASWSSLYVAPFFGWFNAKAFANCMVMGTFNFHRMGRRIQFPRFVRVAHSTYNSYDILLRVNGGWRTALSHTWWFQPEGTFNYLTILTDGYIETGAESLNLQVKSLTTFVLQPSIRAYFINEHITESYCFVPKFYIGWLANIPVGQNSLSARFNAAPSQTLFNIQGYTKTQNQIIFGTELYLLVWNKFLYKTSFELDTLSRLSVYTLKMKFEWLF